MSRFKTSLFVLIILAMVITPNMTVAATAATRVEIVDGSNAESGLITVNYAVSAGQKVKLLVEKDGVRYIYPLPVGTNSTQFPLQLGAGKYSVRVMENIEGNRYRTVYSSKVTANSLDEQQVYLQSIQIVNWQADMDAVKQAQELVAGLDTDGERIAAIYQYIIANFSYDNDKLAQLPADYLPSPATMWKERSGICYDFASLFGAMLRSVNIPTKLVKGYSPNVQGYHAWNEVYVSETKQWVTIDTSYDAQLTAAQQPTNMIKPAAQYSKTYEY